ncbi:sensor histidine kinase [Hydrogenophaga sp.]|uniref:sensor histidine kinase n=1 Tax=Hydrogenophaga sp. TaxID=1904254 RepID=UPI0027313BAB|nr:histidine kinase [Hydrogenophaga sp.]MDP1687956.1 histidine kinase [Hydrogenophaga sp.]
MAEGRGWSWRWLVWIILCLAGSLHADERQAPGSPDMELHEAQATVEVNGRTEQRRLSLPYHWDRNNPGRAGRATFDMVFTLPEVPRESWSLYLPRLGNAYEVWLNGALVQREGDLLQDNGSDYGQVPRLVPLPPGLLQRSNALQVRIRADMGRRGGLSTVWVGPHESVGALYARSYGWRVTGSLIVVGFSLTVGLLSMSLWATQTDLSNTVRQQRDPLYLYAGLAELFWAVRVGDALIVSPPLAWPWWGVVPVVALSVWGWSMGLFCLDVARWQHRPAGRFMAAWLLALLVASGPMAVWALGFGQPLALTAWYACLGLSFLLFGAVFLVQALRGASLPHRVVALAVLLNVVVGFRDLYVFRINPTYADSSLMRYSSVVFGLALGYIVIERFRQVSAQARDLVNNLAARVQEKERELAGTYQQVEQLAREQERAFERTRILRDMHDGVGAHISSAIRQLQSGRASPQELLQTLRDSMDQLKLSIDALNLPPGDVTALLANLRYRLEPRFQASDIALRWAVELIEPVPSLDASGMRQLQFMVFEALSNVLQHAQATELCIEAVAAERGVRLRIVDNGRGFDATLPWRKGLLALRERAHAIGALLSLHSEPGRTVVEIHLP